MSHPSVRPLPKLPPGFRYLQKTGLGMNHYGWMWERAGKETVKRMGYATVSRAAQSAWRHYKETDA